jgi:dCMP deaminase
MNHWDKKFMELAIHVSSWSKDRSTKVGAVIVDEHSKSVLAMGYNGFPRGCDDDQDCRHERPAKYLWTEHAERNAIYNAARNGVRLDGATIYIPLCSCVDCTRAIIQSGIKRVVIGEPKPEDRERLYKTFNFELSLELYQECRVKVDFFVVKVQS